MIKILKPLLPILFICLTQLSYAQTIQRLEEGDVINGKVRQVKETHRWLLPNGHYIPRATGDTMMALVYNFDTDGRMTELKGYYPKLIGKGLKMFDNYQYKYEKAANGEQLVNGYMDKVLRSSGKLNAEGKLIAADYYDNKGKAKGKSTQSFINNNTEGVYTWYGPGDKLQYNRKTTYSSDGQIMAIRYYDPKGNLTLSHEFNVAPDQGLNRTKRICDIISVKHKDKQKQLIEREYVYYP